MESFYSVKRGRAYRRLPNPERFWRFVDKDSAHTSGCWLWTGGRNEHGYGTFKQRVDRGLVTVKAHRFSFELANGTRLDPSVDICHACDNPACVNPNHLFAGTATTNMIDCSAKGRLNNVNAAKMRCHAGHAFTVENTHYRKRGGRECRTCMRERARRYAHSHKA